LVARAFKLTLNTASTAGHDGVDSKGKRFEVKCRRLSSHNKSRQLSAIRGLGHSLQRRVVPAQLLSCEPLKKRPGSI
jgi:hypothetical protein